MTEYPPETCKWQLSGPQFPTPTAIQQRYCYPQGREEYSQCTGSALWTMYNMDGVENKEFRLLHVYYSTKRLHNGGVRSGKSNLGNCVDDQHANTDDNGSIYTSISSSTNSPSKPGKLPKRQKTAKTNHPSKRLQQRHIAKVQPSPATPFRSSFPPSQQQRYFPHKMGNDTGSHFPPTTPIRYGPTTYHSATMGTNGYTVSPPSPWPEASTGTFTNGGSTSSMSQSHNYSYRPQQPFQRYYDRSMPMMESKYDENVQHNHDTYAYSYHDQSSPNGGSPPPPPPQLLPFRRQYHQYHHLSNHHFDDYESNMVVPNNHNESMETATDRTIHSAATDETFPKFTNDFDHHNDDLHSIMMTPIHVGNEDAEDTDSVSLWEEVTEDKRTIPYDFDPFKRVTLPSMRQEEEVSGNRTLPTNVSKGDAIIHRDESCEVRNESNHFQTSLEVVHTKLRDCIHQAPSHDQAELVQLLSSWARQLADDPLTLLTTSKPSADTIGTRTVDHKHRSSTAKDDDDVSSEPILTAAADVDDNKNKRLDRTSNENDMISSRIMAI